MSDRDSARNVIFQAGQSQQDRSAPELASHYVDIDERTPADMLQYAARLATMLNFYDGAGNMVGDWSPLFPAMDVASANQRVTQSDGTVPPHLALYLAFVKLYQTPRALANNITDRHADFFYQDVLGLRPRDATADRAHLVFELKKNTSAVEINPTHSFSAGKDTTGVELLYVPTASTIINTSRVDSLRSVFVDRGGRGTIRFAPISNSADGLGGKPATPNAGWNAFGSAALPPAEVGFAVAAPVLRMQEGVRAVTITLRLSGGDHDRLNVVAAAGSSAFGLYLTGATGWVEPQSVTCMLGSDGTLRYKFVVPADAPAIVDYNSAVHGYAYGAAAPIVQFLLKADSTKWGYFDFAGVVLHSASVSVDVADVTTLTLESDNGTLDAKKAFLPFGVQPTAGARLMIAYPEALNKRLSKISVTLQWKDAPVSFSQRYSAYGSVNNSAFTVSTRFRDGFGTEFTGNSTLFDASNGGAEHALEFSASGQRVSGVVNPGKVLNALQRVNSSWASSAATQLMLAAPVIATPSGRFTRQPNLRADAVGIDRAVRAYATPPATSREGFITLTLNRSFLHAEYRKLFVAAVIATPTKLPDEPYTPTVQRMVLSYSAFSDEVAISSNSISDFANPELQFFQVTPFGPRREHGYQRARFPFVTGTDVTLLPSFPDDGSLLIGLADLRAGDSVSLLFEVAAGSADPELPRQPIHWSVLCDDYWKPLTAQELVRDTTNGLLASGIVGVIIPEEATTTHAILPDAHIWIRASVARDVNAASQLIDVVANGVEVRFADGGNAPEHLEAALAPLQITKSKSVAGGVRTIRQPAASFGGRPREGDANFRTRASERLRHKDRCITAWDYERVVLEAFPAVHRVKCVAHASAQSWKAPGHVMLVVVPDLQNRNSVDPLRPRVDADTLSRIGETVTSRAAMGVRIHVKNPNYQRVRVQFGVAFRAGFEFNHYRAETEQVLIRTLSPWAFLPDREIAFGGTIYRSVLLDVVERLPYVDYVTDFRMYVSTDGTSESADVPEIQPESPDTILVSAPTHIITRA